MDNDVEPGKMMEQVNSGELKKSIEEIDSIFFVMDSHVCIEKMMERVQFWRIERKSSEPFSCIARHWSDSKWKKSMAGGGGNKKRYQYCTDSSGTIVYLRALQGHSGCNLIDPTLQDNVIIQSNFFQYIYHVGCAINLHSIINSGLIPGGQKF